jgi:hypothetical protein
VNTSPEVGIEIASSHVRLKGNTPGFVYTDPDNVPLFVTLIINHP